MTTALAWIGGIVGLIVVVCIAALGLLMYLFRDPNSFR